MARFKFGPKVSREEYLNLAILVFIKYRGRPRKFSVGFYVERDN